MDRTQLMCLSRRLQRGGWRERIVAKSIVCQRGRQMALHFFCYHGSRGSRRNTVNTLAAAAAAVAMDQELITLRPLRELARPPRELAWLCLDERRFVVDLLAPISREREKDGV